MSGKIIVEQFDAALTMAATKIHYVGDLLIFENKLYEFGQNYQKYDSSKTYSTGNVVSFRDPNNSTATALRSVLIKAGSGTLSDPAGIVNAGTAVGDWTLITGDQEFNTTNTTVSGVTTTVVTSVKPAYWTVKGTFDPKDASVIENLINEQANYNNKYIVIPWKNMLVLDPAHFSATIFRRLKEQIESLQNPSTKQRLLNFLIFQRDGYVDSSHNTSKRQRVTPIAPFPIPGVVQIPTNTTRDFLYGARKTAAMGSQDPEKYKFQGKIIEERNGSYVIDSNTLLLRNQEGKWLNKYRGKTGAEEDLVNANNEFFQYKNFWNFPFTYKLRFVSTLSGTPVNGIYDVTSNNSLRAGSTGPGSGMKVRIEVRNGSVVRTATVLDLGTGYEVGDRVQIPTTSGISTTGFFLEITGVKYDKSKLLIPKGNFAKYTESQEHYLKGYKRFVDLISSTERLNVSMARDRKMLDETIEHLNRLFQSSTVDLVNNRPIRNVELRYPDVRSPSLVDVRDMFIKSRRKLVVSFQSQEGFMYDVQIELLDSSTVGDTEIYLKAKGGIHGKAQIEYDITDKTFKRYIVKVRASAGSSHSRNLSQPHTVLAAVPPKWPKIIGKTLIIPDPQTKASLNNFTMGSLYDVDKHRLKIEGKFKTFYDVEKWTNEVGGFNYLYTLPSSAKLYPWEHLDIPSNWNELNTHQKTYAIIKPFFDEVRTFKTNNAKLVLDEIIQAVGDSRLREYIHMSWDYLKTLGTAAGDVDKVVSALPIWRKYPTTYPRNSHPTYSGALSKQTDGQWHYNVNQQMDHTFMLSLDFQKQMNEIYKLYTLHDSTNYKAKVKNKKLQSLPCMQLDLETENDACKRLRKIALCLRKSVEAGYPVIVRGADNAFDSAYNDVRSQVRGRRWTQGLLWERTDKQPGTLIVPGTQRMGRILDTINDSNGVKYMGNAVMQDLLGTGPLNDVPYHSGPSLVHVREASGINTSGVTVSNPKQKGMLMHPLYPSRTKARSQILINEGANKDVSAIDLLDEIVTDVAAYTADTNPIINIEL